MSPANFLFLKLASFSHFLNKIESSNCQAAGVVASTISWLFCRTPH